MRRCVVSLLASAIVTAGCERPGEGKKAREGYTRSQLVIDALQQYRRDQSRYPDALDAPRSGISMPRLREPTMAR